MSEYLPDVIERAESAAERAYDELYQGDGKMKCWNCSAVFEEGAGDTISPDPYAMPVCPACFDKWEFTQRVKSAKTGSVIPLPKGLSMEDAAKILSTNTMNDTPALIEDSTDALTPVEEIPSGLPRADGVAIWGAFQSDIERLKATSATITIRDSQDTHGMKLARDMRLAFRTLRLSIDSKADELKADAQREVKRIEKSARDLRKMCEEQEDALKEKEQFAILEAARVEDELRAARHAELAPWLLPGMAPAVDLGKIGEELWVEMRDRCRTAFEGEQERKRIEEEKRVEAERKRREEEERVRAENARLKKEAEEREAAAKAEREAAEVEQRRLKAEAEERERAAAEERARVEKERAAERAKAEKERLAIEAKAKAEQERQRKEFEAKERAAAEKAKQEREEREAERLAIESANRAAAQAAEKERQLIEAERRRLLETERLRVEKEAKERAAREEAERIKAAAPDKTRLLAYADDIDELNVPVLTGRERLMTELVAARNDLTARIRTTAENLGKSRR